ncbi:HepT-like ribonuclease domain-containing protein [Rhodopila sp.]|uniref:HepT-like ribonuclease domain-containing protein n=1 Tax=Rhodopila sp. TaxID=2480087 RepID=UPI003D118738
MAGVGNMLRHEYERTAPDVLWSVARQDLPTLEKVCREELAAADPPEAEKP